MERSQVKQFKTSNSTIFQSTLLGTHSILARQTSPYYDLQTVASRIAHLPADQRPDLTQQPKILLVFQAIEIERLSTEVQLLRGRLKERQDKVINAGSYQVQIRQLMDRCNKLQSQKYSYRQQLAQTKDMSDLIFNELTQLKARYEEVDFSATEKYKLQKARNEELALQIEKWKNRYASLDRAKGQEVDAARRAIELQRESQLTNGSKELLLRFEIERQQLLARLRQKKQQLSEKDFELKKLSNCFEQAQVRLQQQQHSIEEYEQKVAMLSQETYRLNQLVRIKGQEIKNLKLNNEHDLSLKLSQLNTMDETKNKLHSKLRSLEENNQQLREALKIAEDQSTRLKIKASETQRLEFQVRQARKETENKLKVLQRKDKRIISLEEELKRLKKTEDELSSFRSLSLELANRVQDLQRRIEEKIQELRKVRTLYSELESSCRDQIARLVEKFKQSERLQQAMQKNYQHYLSSQQQVSKKSSVLELEAREAALNLKEKDYKISSLEGTLRDLEKRLQYQQSEHFDLVQKLQQEMTRERAIFDRQARENDIRNREIQLMVRQNESKTRNFELRQKELDYRLKSMDSRCRDLELSNNLKQTEINELKQVVSSLICLQDELIQKQTAISSQITAFKLRLTRIEEILSHLKNNLLQRYKAAQEYQDHLRNTQDKVQDLQEWLVKMAQRVSHPSSYSPAVSPKKKESDRSISPPKIRPFYSPQPTLTYQQNYAQSSSIFAMRDLHSDINPVSTSNCTKQIPIEWLLRFVLLCAQVESLRKKVGDKQAKVESMKSSIASKNNSNSTLINQLHSSSASSQSGFFTTRENGLNRKGNIYY